MAAEQLTPSAVTRLLHEMKDLSEKPAEGITVTFNEDNLADISAEVEGPAGTPFEGGLFKMKLLLPADFPASAPKGFFLTKIFHPNIRYTTGEICVNTLKRDWQPSHGIRHILMVIRCLLIEPFPESALNEEAAKMLLEEYDEYFKRARMLTSIHARNDRKTHKPQGQQLPPPQCGAPGLEGSQDQDAPALGNATNMVSVPADENDEGTAAGGAGGCGEPPLKKLDRKKSLKRL